MIKETILRSFFAHKRVIHAAFILCLIALPILATAASESTRCLISLDYSDDHYSSSRLRSGSYLYSYSNLSAPVELANDPAFAQMMDILKSKHYTVTSAQGSNGDFLLEINLDVGTTRGYRDDLDSEPVAFEINFKSAMQYNTIYKSHADGHIYCRQWTSVADHYADLKYSPLSIFGDTYSAWSDWTSRCDDGMSSREFAKTRVSKIILKRLANIPNCEDAQLKKE